LGVCFTLSDLWSRLRVRVIFFDLMLALELERGIHITVLDLVSFAVTRRFRYRAFVLDVSIIRRFIVTGKLSHDFGISSIPVTDAELFMTMVLE
jgi:hypothetical protein